MNGDVKVGDKIVAIDSFHTYITKGKIYTVLHVSRSGFILNDGDKYGEKHYHYSTLSKDTSAYLFDTLKESRVEKIKEIWNSENN